MNELPLVPLGLLLVRPGLLVATAPALGAGFAPAPARAALAALVALVLLPIVAVPEPAGSGGLALMVAREAVVGLALAMSVRLVIAGAEFAGHLSGFQIGFSYANLVDPQSGVRNSTISALYSGLAVLVFFLVNAHHVLLRILVESYEAIPIGIGGVAATGGTLVTRMLGVVFVLGVQLAAPVLMVLLLVEVALGLLGRVAPSLNLLMFGFPIRLVAGLLAIATVLGAFPSAVGSMLSSSFELAVAVATAFR